MTQDQDFSLQTIQPVKPITIDKENCLACLNCVNACPIDLLIPGETADDCPVVAYPDECWYCGCCVMECPQNAIKLRHPLMNQARWVEKASLKKKEGK